MAYRVVGVVTGVYPSSPKLDDNKKPLKNEDGSIKMSAPAIQIGGNDGVRLQCDPSVDLPLAGSTVDVVARRDSWRQPDGKWAGIMKMSMILRVIAPAGSRRVNDDGEILEY